MNIFETYPELTDGTVEIRRMTEGDADALSRLTAETGVYATLPTFLYELKYDDKILVIRRMDEECFDTQESILMGIYLCDDPDNLIGIAEIYNYEDKKDKASIGYRLSEEVWGRGIATRVTALLKNYLLETAGLRTVTAHVLHENGASARVLMKNGFINKYPELWEDWGFDRLMLTDKYVFKKEWLEADSPEHTGQDAVAYKLTPVEVEQFVMAYGIEQDRIRAMLPDGYTSLRPVLRINTEIRDGKVLYIEFNTPVEADGRRGWLNISNWKSTNDDIGFLIEGCMQDDETGKEEGTAQTGSRKQERKVVIKAPFLSLTYTGTGIEGGCPAEKDNEGCYYIGNDLEFRPAEKISGNKEFCDCEFRWSFNEGDAHGKSERKTIPAFDTPQQVKYDRISLTAENAAAIPCRQVLGAYIVRFTRIRING